MGAPTRCSASCPASTLKGHLTVAEPPSRYRVTSINVPTEVPIADATRSPQRLRHASEVRCPAVALALLNRVLIECGVAGRPGAGGECRRPPRLTLARVAAAVYHARAAAPRPAPRPRPARPAERSASSKPCRGVEPTPSPTPPAPTAGARSAAGYGGKTDGDLRLPQRSAARQRCLTMSVVSTARAQASRPRARAGIRRLPTAQLPPPRVSRPPFPRC